MSNVLDTNANLLVALDALLRERSVTRAAKRIGVTQPSMSGTLAQLRELFDDELLVRVGRQMEPTPRALEIGPLIRNGVASFEAALAGPAAFDPASSTARFVVAMNDFSEFVLLPPLLDRVSREAPNVALQVVPWGKHEPPTGLAVGPIDVMTGFFYAEQAPVGHHSSDLFRSQFATIARKRHPAIAKRLTLSTFAKLNHIIVTENIDATGNVDTELARVGRSRHIAARVPHFMLVPNLVAKTNLVATIERCIAEHFAKTAPISIYQPPLKLPRGIVRMMWHSRTDGDPARQWLRQLLHEVAMDD